MAYGSFFSTALAFTLLLVMAFLCGPVNSEEQSLSLQRLGFDLNEKFLITADSLNVASLIDEFLEEEQEKMKATDMDKNQEKPKKEKKQKQEKPKKEKKKKTKKKRKDDEQVDDEDDESEDYGNKKGEEVSASARSSSYFEEWFHSFEKRHKLLLEEGKSESACIIRAKRPRRKCCYEYVRSSSDLHHHGRQFMFFMWEKEAVYRCMRLIDKHFIELEQKSLKLSLSDEVCLTEHLEFVFEVLPSELQPDRDSQWVNTYSRASDVEPSESPELIAKERENLLREEAKKTLERKRALEKIRRKALSNEKAYRRRLSNIKKLTDFLVNMKQKEKILRSLLLNHEVQDNDADMNIIHKFISEFQKLYKDSLTGTFFHGVEREWMTCGLISYEDEIISSYCAYLSLIDPQAPELSRKPIFRWESGRQMILTNRRRHHFHTRHTERSIALTVEPALYVDLFGSTSACPEVDLVYGCYAMCCDSVFGYSQFCATRNLRCIS